MIHDDTMLCRVWCRPSMRLGWNTKLHPIFGTVVAACQHRCPVWMSASSPLMRPRLACAAGSQRRKLRLRNSGNAIASEGNEGETSHVLNLCLSLRLEYREVSWADSCIVGSRGLDVLRRLYQEYSSD